MGYAEEALGELHGVSADVFRSDPVNASSPLGVGHMVPDFDRRTDLTVLAQEVHQNSKDHGFWDILNGLPINLEFLAIATKIALSHSELSEALEEVRNNTPLMYYRKSDGKPEGIIFELVDDIIRDLDLIAYLLNRSGIANRHDINELVKIKHHFNQTRPVMHGGKKF